MLRWIPRTGGEDASALHQAGYAPALAELLAMRGIHSPEEARAFLSPGEDQLHPPGLMQDMERGVAAIREAMARKARITIFGDYDVDGVTATAILMEAFAAHGVETQCYIPSRHEEGYGLNNAALDQLAEYTDLLITVDCGITAAQEVAYAASLGMQVVVTDHHEAPEMLPDCAAVINPLLGDYPFGKLCGAGVAFKLAQALFGWETAEALLPLAALGTVADLVPLVGENRVIAALGLARMQQTQHLGLRALIEGAGLEGKTITAGHLGYQIAPRLNAGGRLSHAGNNVTLLRTKDPEEAREIVRGLNEENDRRKRLEQKIFDQAEAWVREQVDFLETKVLVVEGELWNHGVIGLVASRLVERYRHPVVVLSRTGDSCTGSARSIPGVHIHRALSTCEDLFTRFGGHSQAAGMTLPEDAVPEFRRRLNQAVRELAEPEAFIPTERYDVDIQLEDLTLPLVEQLEALAPFGIGNPAPTFCLRDAAVVTARAVGADQSHLRLRLGQEGQEADAIAFRQAQWLERMPSRINALVQASINEWQGRREVSCQVQQLQPCRPEEAFLEQCIKRNENFQRAILDQIAYNKSLNLFPGVQCLPREGLRSSLARWLREGEQGVLLIPWTVQAAQDLVEWLRAEGLQERVSYCLGTPEDRRAYHTVCGLMEPAALKVRYDRIVFLDGRPDQEDALLLLAACPGASLWADDSAGGWRRQEVAAITPSDEQMRGLYRALRAQAGVWRRLDWLVDASGMTETMVWAGLMILEELRLIAWKKQPFEVILEPMRKCDLNESTLLGRMRRAAVEREARK